MATYDYTTTAEVLSDASVSSGVKFPSTYNDVVDRIVTDVSRAIDDYKRVEAGSYAAGDGNDVVRYFFGSGKVFQTIDPCASLTSVEVEEVNGTYTAWVEDTDFFLYPENYSMIGEPIVRLDVNWKGSGNKSVWAYGQRRVKVTGKFGISLTTPHTIGRAALIQSSRWLKRAQTVYADKGGNAELGQLSVSSGLDRDVRTLLDNAYPHMLVRL